MKLRTSFRVITIFSVTVLLLGAIGFISIQARKANLKNSISPRPITVQPAASRPTIKKAHAFGQKEAEETSSFNLYKYSFGFEPMFFVPTVTATKTASLATDVNGNGFVNPGDTLMYSVVVSNSGTDAMNVVFSDQLNANLTQSGSATASPIATNDAYTSIGNVGITVPAGSGLLINDINPQGTGTISIMAVPAGTTTQGGSYALAADGSFSYNPPVGFEGADSFVYTLTHTNGKMDTGTVNLTVSGMIWFINNNAAACTTIAGGCGRLSSPFSTLAAFNAVNIGGGSNPATNDNIFIYESGTQYTGAVTLLTGQKLIGQDATATLATITGISVPTFSNALPAMNSGNGTITNIGSTVTLNTNTTLRGLSINSGGQTGVNDPAGAITGVSVSEVSVTSTTGIAVLLSSTGGTISFIKVSAGTGGSGPSNGISLTSTTGSFTVTGTGTAGSGGTIQNTTGHGVALSTAASVSLSWMNIQNSGDDGINGSTVTGFSFSDGSVINNGNSTSDEGFDFTDLFGTCSITNATVTGNAHNNFKLLNNSGTLTSLTVSGSSFSSNSNANGNHGFLFETANSAVASAVSITSTTFSNNVSIGLQVLAQSTSTISSFIVSGCTFSDTGTGNTQEISADFSSSGGANMTYKFLNNTVTGMNSNAFNTFTAVDAFTGGTLNGTIDGNTIGTQATVDSGSRTGGGMRININGNAMARIKVNNNTLRQIPTGRGIEAIARNGTGGASFIITNNTIVAPTGTAGALCGAGVLCPLAPIHVQTNTVTVANNACSVVSGNTAYDPTSVPGGAGGEFSVQLLETSTSQLTYEGNVANTALVNLTNANPGCVTKSVTGAVTVVAAGTCAAPPPIAQPIEVDEQLKQNSGNTSQLKDNGSASPTLFARMRQWLAPVFSAFSSSISYVNLDKAFGKVEPTVAAAERVSTGSDPVLTAGSNSTDQLATARSTASLASPARTMIVNSRGEARIVPTASLSAMAGELITLPTSGSFTLPAGESTTIMFNATIAANFTGTAITNQALVSGSNFSNVLSNNLSTPVIQAPNFTMAFNPSTIATNTGISTATFTLVNPNPSQSLSGVIFQLTLAGGVQVAATPAASTSGCGAPSWNPAAAATNMTFSGGSIAAGGTCTVNVNVRGIQELNATFLTTQAVSTEANDSSPASAPLKVINTPTFTKAFGGSTVPLNGTTSLTFTITNGSAAFPLNGIGFTDSLPAGLIVDTPSGLSTTCNGAVGASPGGGSVTWSGGSLVATASCTISLNVKGTTAGAKPNSATLATTELGANSAATGTVTLTVLAPPTISKAFSPTSIFVGGTFSQLTFTITNPNTSGTLTGVGFSDNFPGGLQVDTSPGVVVSNCGGSTNTSSFTPGATSLNVSNASVTAGTSCTIKVNVIGTTAGAKPNTTGAITSTEGGTGTVSNTATLNVFTAPQITKSFGASSLPVNGTTTVTFTITNPAENPGALSTITFIDSLPPGMVVANPPAPTNTCGGSVTAVDGSGTISLGGASIATPGNTCQVQATVKVTTSGVKNNNVTVSSGNGGTGNTATASLTVANPPTVAKSFSPTSIPLNGTSTLTLNFTNPNAFALSGLAISDAFPPGMEVDATPAATNTCGGVFAPAAGNTSISLAGGSLTSSGSCSISVAVKGTTVGAKNNTTGNVSTTESGAGGTSNTATLTVIAPPSMLKSFGSVVLISTATASGTTVTITTNSPHNFTNGQQVAITGVRVPEYNGTFTITSVPTATTFTYTNPVSGLAASTSGATAPASSNVALNGLISMSIEIINTNNSSLSGIGFLDTLPAGITVPASFSTSFCGGTLNVTAPNSVSLSGASLAAGGGCIQAFSVRGAQAGSWQNTFTNVTSTESGPGPNSNTATLNVFAPPTIAKSFSPTGVQIGGTSTLTLTITNPAANPAGVTGVAVSDAFPPGLEVNTTPGATNTCGGTFTAAAMATSISLTGGSIPTAGGSCSVSVTVKATTAGSKLNATGTVSSTEGGTGLTAAATLAVAATPTVAKSFSPSSIPLNGTSTLTLSFTNPNAFALSGLAISDSFPAGVEVAASPAATNTCGGVFAPAAGNTSISLSGGSLASSGSCSISVAVKGTTAGPKNNVTGSVSSTESGNGGTANATLNVFAPPTIAKAFSPTGIPLNGTSTLTITITNPAANPAGAVNGVAVSDTFPAGLVVDTTPAATNTCGGTFSPAANASSIALTGGTIASAGGSCSISVKVKGTTAGAKPNTTGAVSSTEGGTGLTASATLNVFAPPTITKAFSPTTVAPNGTSTLTITITNPAANPAGVTGVAVSDTFPAGMEVNTTPGATNTCGGTFSPAAMATSISLTGGSIASAGGSCSISVVVKGTTAGPKNNVTGTVSSTEGGTGLTASATLTVAAAPTVAKSFSPTSIPVGGTSTLTISFTNPNAFALNGLAITDSFPAGVEVNATPGATNTCGGTFAPSAAATSISLSGGSLASSGSCSISVSVKATTGGAKNNVTGNVSTTESGNGGTANATLNVFAPPTITKAFSPTGVPLNGTSTLTITITNPAANPGALNGVAVSDTFPAGLVVDTTPAATNTCGGTFSPVANAGSIALTGGTIASAGGSCSISVKVKGTTAGAKPNTTGAVSSTEGGTGLTASATLNVFAPPTITKAFSPTTIAPNGTSTLTLTITNPAANPAGVTGVAVSDSFPPGMEVNTTPGATNTCGGTFSPAAMATSISLTGGSIASAGGSCSISVVVKGTTAGVKNNVTGAVSSTEGGTGLTASATLTVAAPPTVAKSFSPTSVMVNGTSTLTLNFTNSNAIPLSGLAITDSFPAGVEVAATPGATNTCGGTFAPAAAATSISLTGGSLAASGSCSISVTVKGTTAGAKNNVTGTVSSTESGAGGTANATLNVFTAPTIAKAFSPTTIALNGNSTLTITITNPAANPTGITGVAVSDTFPAGLVVDTTPAATNTCGGTFSPVANASSIALTGGTIASAGGSCSISVKVKGTTAGAKPNTTGAVSSTEGGTGSTATATLNVFAPLTVAKSFSPTSILLNTTSTLTITLTNPASNPGGMTNIAISDPFPAGMEVDATPMATNTCGGTFAPAAAATTISLTGGAIASAGGSCSISVKVKGTTQGVKTNTTGTVSSTEGGTGGTATATLDVFTCSSIVCPTDVFVGTTGNSAVVTYPAPSPNGICGTITCTPASGSSFNVGTTTVTCNSSIGNQSCSFKVTVNRVNGTVSDPLLCTGPGNNVSATLVISNNGNANQTIADTTTFTNLVGVPGSCTLSPNVGTCTVTNGNLTYNATLTPGQTVTISYLTQVSDLAPSGAQVCSNNSVTFNGGTPVVVTACATVNCPPAGPGNPIPAASEGSDQKAGSVLIYNLYTSGVTSANTQNTRINITNTHTVLPAYVHLFFVAEGCSIADSYICLTGSQTASFLASDMDPGTTGYLVAVATDAQGCPRNFNYLIGDEYVKLTSGHAANLSAQAFTAIPGGRPACDQNSVTATLNFDGISYNRIPAVLALDSVGSRADGNDTLLVVNRIGGNLGIGASTLGTLFGVLYDDAENSLSFSVSGNCQLRNSISNNFPRTTPRFETFIPAGRTGWMKLFSQTGTVGITGAAINFNANSASSAGAFNQGHNLHVMTLSSTNSYVIPVFPPSC